MARFDFIEAASQAYIFVWKERRAVAFLALPCLLVKLFCLALIEVLGVSDNFLRSGLVILPAYFAEGWMLAHLIRLALYGEYWPYRGDEEGDASKSRSRCILAGIIVYVLIDLILTGVSSFVVDAQMSSEGTSVTEPTMLHFLGALAAFITTIWAFRLVWLYIPAVMGYSMKQFLFVIKGYVSSFYMLGAFFVCLLPTLLILRVLFGGVLYLLPGGLDNPGMMAQAVILVVQVIVQTAIAIITTLGMTYAIRAMLYPQG